jgi:hypothetical protein
MDQRDFKEQLQTEIRRTGCDPRAEIVLALALDMGLAPEDFFVSCDDLFSREYSKDITYTEVKEDSRMKHLLQIHLSRGGIYDQLPEGLFFQPDEKKKGNSASDMAADHKLNKKKEEEIRRFFQPFEQDFFWQRVELEREEARLLEGVQSGILNDYFTRFWGIPREIPKQFIAPFLLLLPYAHRISGDLALMGNALEQLLQEKTTVRKSFSSETALLSADTPGLGNAVLGTDMVCDGFFSENIPGIEWTIGPLQRSSSIDYLEGGERYELLRTFNRFFVPAGIDSSLMILVDPARSQLVLGSGEGAILGYSCMLTSIGL